MANIDVFQQLLDKAVSEGVGPGFQCTVFSGDNIFFNGVSGFATLPSEASPAGTPIKPETLHYFASCAKLYISLIILHILEQGLTKDHLSLEALDSHEALVTYLPEFKPGSGSLVNKIIEGFKDERDSDGRRIMKLRDAKTPITLRMLLTHTVGIDYGLNCVHIRETYLPSDGSPAYFGIPSLTGNISDLQCPLVAEPNTTFNYGFSGEWLGLFAFRSTGKNIRQHLKDILLDPLCISRSQFDICFSPSEREAFAGLHIRNPEGGFTQIPQANDYTVSHDPPEGKTMAYGSTFFATSRAYTKVLQAVLRQDTRILSKEAWRMAIKDDLAERGIEVPRPMWKNTLHYYANSIDVYAKCTAANARGINLLQAQVTTAPTVSGRSAGSFGWGGLANTYYFVDPAKNVGAVLTTQLYPFFDPKVVDMRDEVERLVYKVLG